MTKYRILIDPETVKPNPQAGSSDCIISNLGLMCELEIKSSSGAAYAKNMQGIHENHIVREYIHGDGTISTYLKGGQEIMGYIEKLKDTAQILSYTEKQQTKTYRLMEPQPSHTFKYLPTKINCPGCYSTFYHTFLKEDCDSENICPVCEEPECFEMEYQTLQDYLNEQ